MPQDSQSSVHNYEEIVYSESAEEESSAAEMSTSSKRLKLDEFDPNVERELFAKMIAKHDFPLLMSQYPYLRRWISYIMSIYDHRTISTVENDLMSVYAQEKSKICAEIEKLSSRVTLSIDGWMNEYQNWGYISVTCHFIDDNWVLRKRILSLRVVDTYPSLDMSWVLYRWLVNKLVDWHIDKKMFSIMIDNTSHSVLRGIRGIERSLNDKKALLHGGDMFQFRSFTHIIDHFINIGLKALRGLIWKIEISIMYIGCATERRKKFDCALIQCQFSPQKCILFDIDTRWNSTCNSKCKMLNAALEIREAFARLAELDSEYEFLPSDEEWDKGKKICACLNIFRDVTERLSRAKYPTLNYYFLMIWNIRAKLGEWKSSDVSYIVDMASLMIKKFDKYWEEYNMVLTIAAVLDPRYKMKVVEFVYTKLDKERGSLHIDKVSDFMFGLFSEYSGDQESEDSSCSHEHADTNELHEIYFNYMSQNGGFVARKNDLERYLEESVETPKLNTNENYDVLEWWKRHGPRFPALAKMARDVFAIPASSLASDSEFTRARRILSDLNSSIKHESIEPLFCLKDWLPPLEYECLLEEMQVDGFDDADNELI